MTMAIRRSDQSIGYIYLLSNQAMPGMVKIGQTSRPEVNSRVEELYTTSVPLPYCLEGEWFVESPAVKEMLVHTALHRFRVAPNREFFELSVDEARDRITAVLYKFDNGAEFEIVRPFLEAALMMQMAVKYPEKFKKIPISHDRLSQLLDAVESVGENKILSPDLVDIIKRGLVIHSERYNQAIKMSDQRELI